jgi:hypothetical protein
MHGDKASLPLWGDDSYAVDLIATGVLLPGITWLILRPLLLKQAAKGKAPSTDGVPQPLGSRVMPSTLWGGAAVIGLVGGLIGLATAGMLQVLGAPDVPGTAYAAWKAVYCGLFPVLLQPAMVFAILRPVTQVPARAA